MDAARYDSAMTSGVAGRALAALGLASLMIAGVAGPALACDPRLSDLRDSRSFVETVRSGQVPAPTARTPSSATAITPGTVNRSSVNLTARYLVGLTLGFSSRSFQANTVGTITNTSGGPIDRVELNTIAARLGAMHVRIVEVDGRRVSATVSDQTIVVPLGGVLAAGATVTIRVHYSATLRSSLSGSNWMFTRDQRHRRRIPLDPMGQSPDPVRAAEPWRSVRHPGEPGGHRQRPGRPPAGHRLDGRWRLPVERWPDAAVRRAERTGRHDHGRARFPDGDRDARGEEDPLLLPLVGEPGHSSSMRRSMRSARCRGAWAPYPYSIYKVVQSAGGYGMESPGLTWIPFGVGSANLRYLVAHETAHQWFYSLVGNDQARQPFADEAVADFVARDVTATRRASRCGRGSA